MLLEEWNGYLFVFVGNKVYLADSRGIFTNENHMEYDWFYWELPKAVTCTQVQDGVLYLGTADGVYTLTDNTCNLESYWVTPKDKFNSPNLQKTTNKRGFVAEATGDIAVSVKTESTEFEPVSTHNGVTDYFVSRIKVRNIPYFGNNHCTRVNSNFMFNTSTNNRTVTFDEWNCLTLHVCTHQCTVSSTVFDKWNKSCSFRNQLTWR